MPAPVCADELTKLYDAIMALQTGTTVVSVGFGERNVTYSQSNLAALKDLYKSFWLQCGAAEGYPDLSGAAARGRPARYSMF